MSPAEGISYYLFKSDPCTGFPLTEASNYYIKGAQFH